ncbi:MAG: hypothetical protein R6X12_09695 [bacterium]
MKGKLLPALRTGLSAAGLLAAGCSLLGSPLSPLAITLGLDSRQLRVGDTLTCTATVWNKTARPVTMDFSCWHQVRVVLYETGVTPVVWCPSICVPACSRLELDAFERRDYPFEIPLARQTTGAPLRPGLYRVRASLTKYDGPSAQALLIITR